MTKCPGCILVFVSFSRAFTVCASQVIDSKAILLTFISFTTLFPSLSTIHICSYSPKVSTSVLKLAVSKDIVN